MWNKIILSKELNIQITEKIDSIYLSIKENDNDDKLSLINGKPGSMLFYAYYAHYRMENELMNDALDNLEFIFENSNKNYNLNLSAGQAGILYAINHLTVEDFVELDDDALKFDPLLFSKYIEKGNLDFLHGSTGVIFSILQLKNFKEYSDLFSTWLNAIKGHSEHSDDYLLWKIPFDQGNGIFKHGYSLGLSHGTPSVISIFLEFINKKILAEETLPLLTKALNFLIASRFETPADFYFPCQIIDGIKSQSRLAWCYGDLGCAIVLFKGSKILHNESYSALANEIFEKHALKRDPVIFNIKDADFCHGSVGIAHMYARMYNYTGKELYRETSEYWYKITIEKAVFTDGLAGYKHFKGGDKPSFENSIGFLEGVCGIGLSFISAISDREPKWDNAFLLS